MPTRAFLPLIFRFYRPLALALDVALSADSVRPMNIFRDALISMLGLCLIFTCVAPIRAAREEMPGSIEQVMTPGEFKAAGLNKLSAEELQKLNAWLQGYREVAEKTAKRKLRRAPRG